MIFGGVFLLSESLGHAIIYGREIIYCGTLIAILASFISLFMYFWQNKDLFFE